MKTRTVSLWSLSLILVLGTFIYYHPVEAPEVTAEPPPELLVATEPAEPEKPAIDLRSMIPPVPEPDDKEILVAPTIKQPRPEPIPQTKRQISHARYWKQAAINFDQKWEQLEAETNPARRLKMIQMMSGYVRIDTLATLDWAMGLEDEEEKRAALEAINKNALTGIGARIEIDQSGFPKIRETTVLSAAEATGQVQSGDYISGIVNANGTTTSFKGRPIQEIVKLLRGQPGTQVHLIVERPPSENQPEPAIFDVPVQRSLIVVGPPL